MKTAIHEGSRVRDYEWYASWYIEDEGEEGAEVGQDGNWSFDKLEKAYREALANIDSNETARSDAEYMAVEIAAKRFAEDKRFSEHVRLRNSHWEFESRTIFKKFLAFIRAAEKTALSKTPWPAWALTAKAEGWKPPKGWKPGGAR